MKLTSLIGSLGLLGRATALFLCGIGGCHAAVFALLVGVSEYPTLSPEHQLAGPRQDVQLLSAALRNAGVPGQNIHLLADGVQRSEALPSRYAILDGLTRLAKVVAPGDWVVILLSGHGSRAPQGHDGNGLVDPDGKDAIFLPRDIGRWTGSIRRVGNAILDDMVGEGIWQLQAHGARVFLIADTCHAEDMIKAPGVGRSRYVDPDALGIPERSWVEDSLTAFQTRPPLHVPDMQNVVAFYGAHAAENAQEEPLPDLLDRAQGGTRTFGVFTWYLARALQQQKFTSFAELADQVAHGYREDHRPFPTPAYGGNLGLDATFLKAKVGSERAMPRKPAVAGAADRNPR